MLLPNSFVTFLLLFAIRIGAEDCTRSHCLNGGKCEINADSKSSWCRCPPTFFGDHCEFTHSSCYKSCSNGGLCVRKTSTSSSNSTFCSCPLGFEGVSCEKPVLDSICSRSKICGDHGTCHLTSSLEDYVCVCRSGFYGDHCENRDLCPRGYCKNGGFCNYDGSQYTCKCPPNYYGSRCELDVDECLAHRCIHGSCTNTFGSFHCSCYEGYHGELCEFEQCKIHGNDCRNGGVCEMNANGTGTYCICPPAFEGAFCESDVDECSNNPCFNGATCQNTRGGFSCLCPNGFRGHYCEQNVDDCSSNPCTHGGKCVDGIGMYSCECPVGRIGNRCEKEDPCVHNPCQHGTCTADVLTGDFHCSCAEGFTGDHCEIDVDECQQGAHCFNNGSCINTPGSFHCSCPLPFTGRFCDKLMNSCSATSCLNHGTCVERLDHFICACMEGFYGEHCEKHGVTCPERSCMNNGVCEGKVCICTEGFAGPFCERKSNRCGNFICQEGYVCRRSFDGSQHCGCPDGFYGARCEHQHVVNCSMNPCAHGSCKDIGDSFYCHCPMGYTGDKCEEPVDLCSRNPCMNNGICVHDINGFQCRCASPYSGRLCEKAGDPCARNSCGFNEVCVANGRNYTCKCKPGFSGDECQVFDLCSMSPCHHGGKCVQGTNSFECQCPLPYSGTFCEKIQPFCSTAPCKNNGSCYEKSDGFSCDCAPGFTGATCEQNVVCLNNMCENNAECISTDSSHYKCKCASGFSGRFCEVNVDDCAPSGLCLNGGICIDGVNSYTCQCARGFGGKNCQISIDVDRFNRTDEIERSICLQNNCANKADNGICDMDCNLFACSFDGGDCSAKTMPFAGCPTASYCFRVFRDGKCDEVCNNEACLFDGFDCGPHEKTCSSKDYCQSHYRDGHCDLNCNTLACGFDGGDCEDREKSVATLDGSISLVLEISPNEFVDRLNEILMKLSSKIRGLVLVDRDEKGAMAFVWRNGIVGERIDLPSYQVASVIRRQKRRSQLIGVKVDLVFDMTHCHGECFSDVAAVADFLGTAQTQKEFVAEFGIPIHEAIVRRPTNEPPSYKLLWICVLAGSGLVLLGVGVLQTRRTRKRRVITAPTWYPPTEAQNKYSMSEHDTMSLRLSIYPSNSSIIDCKRTKLDNLALFGPGFVAPPINRVQPRPFIRPIYDDPTPLHEQVASMKPITLPIDSNMINARCSPCGRTPLIELASNTLKEMKILLEDVQKLYNAGANLDAQDEDEETAIFVATRHQNVPMVRLLLELGADPTIMNKNNSTCLHQACHLQNVELARELLSSSKVVKEVNEVDAFDRTPLAVCAMDSAGQTGIAQLLLDNGADPSHPGDKSSPLSRGRTPLHYAAQHSNIAMLKFLIEKGANKDAQDQQDCTPLFLAAEAGKIKAVQALVAAGASTDIADQKDRAPRHVAKENDWQAVVEALPPSPTGLRPLPMPVQKPPPRPKATAQKPSKKATKRTQPLTPPHSDSTGTPSPPESSYHLRPSLLCPSSTPLLDSPEGNSHKHSPNTNVSPLSSWHTTNNKSSPCYADEPFSDHGIGVSPYTRTQPYSQALYYDSYLSDDNNSSLTFMYPNV